MKERPIIFSAPMVRALLEGRKTQTRRVIKPQPQQLDTGKRYWQPRKGNDLVYVDLDNGYAWWEYAIAAQECPYGAVGDRLWVRETHTYADINWSYDGGPELVAEVDVDYKADDARHSMSVSDEIATHVSQWIEDKEAMGNGDNWRPSIYMPRWASRITLEITNVRVERAQDISQVDAMQEGTQGKHSYAVLWDTINAKRGYGWDSNPWVWAITFRMVTP